MTFQSARSPASFISGTRLYRSSATPPPKLVALTWHTRTPWTAAASSRISVISSRETIEW